MKIILSKPRDYCVTVFCFSEDTFKSLVIRSSFDVQIEKEGGLLSTLKLFQELSRKEKGFICFGGLDNIFKSKRTYLPSVVNCIKKGKRGICLLK